MTILKIMKSTMLNATIEKFMELWEHKIGDNNLARKGLSKQLRTEI